jgi:hypothetical protein
MTAIQLNNQYSYTSRGITITPDPPQVGVEAVIALELSNTGTQPLTVRRIEPMVAQFGMGVTWEQLPLLGPLSIAPNQVERVVVSWTPGVGGHRCLRANIYTDLSSSPVRVGRNMRVIESETATQFLWGVPFALGNPQDQPAPVLLALKHDPLVQASLVIKERLVFSGEAIELAAREEAQGTLLLLAETKDALESTIDVEAFIRGQFLDGLEVTLRKPALERGDQADRPLFTMHNEAIEVGSSLAGSARHE